MISLIVHNAEEFQAALPRTGLFEMFDCAIAIDAPQNYPVREVEQMVKILQYSINVTDVKISVLPEDGEDVHVVITDTPYNPSKRRTPNRPKS